MSTSPQVQGRHVRLVVRRVEPWTVLKFSVLLFTTFYLVVLVAGAVLWALATATGLRENVERFIGDLIASDDFRILGPTMMRASVVGGSLLVVLGTGANVLFAVLYNLISDVVGGIALVLDERPTRRSIRRQAASLAPSTRPPRRPVTRLPPPQSGPDVPPPLLKPANVRRRRPTERPPDNTPMPDLPVPPGPVRTERTQPVDFTRPAD